jgi:Flp pilus assembly protein TadB
MQETCFLPEQSCSVLNHGVFKTRGKRMAQFAYLVEMECDKLRARNLKGEHSIKLNVGTILFPTVEQFNIETEQERIILASEIVERQAGRGGFLAAFLAILFLVGVIVALGCGSIGLAIILSVCAAIIFSYSITIEPYRDIKAINCVREEKIKLNNHIIN